jgi:hypothetical protein
LDTTPGDSNDLTKQLRGNDRWARATLCEPHWERLRHRVVVWLDPWMRGRLDASDVVQDEFLDVAGQHDERPCIVDTFFALARHQRGNPSGKVHLGITR